MSLDFDDTIGFINDDAHNGDGAEHLHLGVRLDHDTTKPYGYEKDVAPLSGYCPAHMVIAASRIGVFVADDTHPEPYWNNEKSQAFMDVWWDKNSDGGYRYMDLENYHNKLGRPNNNHPDAPIEEPGFIQPRLQCRSAAWAMLALTRKI